MSVGSPPQLAAHLRRHARKLHNIACGFGRRRDADDIIQILYARWWRRIQREPGWAPPEESAALFVCVKRVVMDEAAKEQRLRARSKQVAGQPQPPSPSPEESLHAFERLRWILARLPTPLADALKASLSAGRRNDAAVARELGLSHSAYTGRLFKARRAAEQLAAYYDYLPLEQASLMAELSYSGKTHAQIAHDLCLLMDEFDARWKQALDILAKHTAVAL